MNSLNAIGNISRDAELRFTKSGDLVLQFNFALSSGYGDNQITTWLNCSLFGKRAETLAPMLLKGTKIGITGEFYARPYQTKEGVEKLSLECRISNVTLLGSKQSGDTPLEERQRSEVDTSLPIEDIDSDIPF